jgi:hypothetical protein
MKRLVILAATIIFISCSKTKTFMNTGVITGPDPRTCACCGGYFFHFTNVPDTLNKELVNSGIFQFSGNVKFPVYVQVDWQATNYCGGTAIKIISFKLL